MRATPDIEKKCDVECTSDKIQSTRRDSRKSAYEYLVLEGLHGRMALGLGYKGGTKGSEWTTPVKGTNTKWLGRCENRRRLGEQ